MPTYRQSDRMCRHIDDQEDCLDTDRQFRQLDRMFQHPEITGNTAEIISVKLGKNYEQFLEKQKI